MSQREKFVHLALADLGVKEADGGDDKYIKWYADWLSLNAAWCAIYVSYKAHEAGISEDIIPKFCDCDKGLVWFKNHNLFVAAPAYGGKTIIPKKGWIIFFSSHHTMKDSTHVGIVTGATKYKVSTVEGNSNDAVREKKYNLNDAYILGYGTPAFKEDDEFCKWIIALKTTFLDGNPTEELLAKTPTLKRGVKNDVVKLVQQRLIGLGYNLGSYGADGSYGPATEAAVKEFQKKELGFKNPDGIMTSGQRTWRGILQL
jgi:hypothetical protein